MNNHIVLACPHCEEYILIFLKELNCRIFRHGVYKDTLQQIETQLLMRQYDGLMTGNNRLQGRQAVTSGM